MVYAAFFVRFSGESVATVIVWRHGTASVIDILDESTGRLDSIFPPPNSVKPVIIGEKPLFRRIKNP